MKKIDSGEYLMDSKIPSEQDFCELYEISRPTVRQAISELTNNGYLYKKKGKGTFVAAHKATIDIKNYSGFTDSILDNSNIGNREIISTNTVDAKSCKRLFDIFNEFSNYHIGNEFAEIKYLTIQDTQVLSLNTSYIPMSMFPDIIDDIKGNKPSHDILKGKYPLLPVKAKSKLEIIYTDQSDARYLHVQTGQCLIEIENMLFSKSSQLVELIISKYRADKCKLMFDNIK